MHLGHHAAVSHSVDHGQAHHAVEGAGAALFVPGAAAMAHLKSQIRYEYATSPLGGSVSISTSNADALRAVHEFLRYQITEHRTGDSGTVRIR
jgi:hypothetical protein